MSHQGTWADALVIQAVAETLNLSLHIIESNPGFASVANISPLRAIVMNTGHLDEIHYMYVPNVPCNQSNTEEAPQENYLDPKCTADSLIFSYNQQF